MKTVKTVWEWSIESEAKRLIHAAHSIANGFFRTNNFFLVQWKPGDIFSPITMPFPDLPYQTIPRFWDRVKRVDIRSFPLNFPSELVEATIGLLDKLNVREPEIDQVKGTWNQAKNEVMETIETIISGQTNGKFRKLPIVKRIIIHPTNFGTTCSFSVADRFPAAVEVYLRIDQDIYSITEAILSAITRNEIYQDLDGLWSESELLVDWLLMKSSLSPILKKYQPITTFMPTVKYIRMKQSAKLMKQSEEFYRRLGVPILENVFGLKDGQPTIAGRPMENISIREQKILRMMIEKNNTIVAIDELADLLFNNDEEFSLAAIAKTIQRLRDKLEQNGVSGSFIQTLRGQGYILKN